MKVQTHTNWPARIELAGTWHEVSDPRFVDVLRAYVMGGSDRWRLQDGDVVGLEFTWGGGRFRAKVRHEDDAVQEGQAA